MLKVILWTPGQSLGNLSPEKVKEIQGIYSGPLVAVVDDYGDVNIIQPMDPNTGENWLSDEDAIRFGENYINAKSLNDIIE